MQDAASKSVSLSAALRRDANIIASIIEGIDHRAMAADIVTPTLEEATNEEMIAIYQACKRIQKVAR